MTKLDRGSMLWLLAGIIFLSISIRDIFFEAASNKSGMIISFEVIAGICLVLLALIQWRRNRTNKAA
jgi:hypothetical protein